MKRLGESAQKISQVVSLIDELALKTNLLSINASVEAARAGELGQGFYGGGRTGGCPGGTVSSGHPGNCQKIGRQLFRPKPQELC